MASPLKLSLWCSRGPAGSRDTGRPPLTPRAARVSRSGGQGPAPPSSREVAGECPGGGAGVCCGISLTVGPQRESPPAGEYLGAAVTSLSDSRTSSCHHGLGGRRIPVTCSSQRQDQMLPQPLLSGLRGRSVWAHTMEPAPLLPVTPEVAAGTSRGTDSTTIWTPPPGEVSTKGAARAEDPGKQ